MIAFLSDDRAIARAFDTIAIIGRRRVFTR
jgi:hypothetical protein